MLTAHTLNDRICAHFHNAAHAMEVPANARLLFCNGQVGARLDGTVPEKPLEQMRSFDVSAHSNRGQLTLRHREANQLRHRQGHMETTSRTGPIMGDHKPTASSGRRTVSRRA